MKITGSRFSPLHWSETMANIFRFDEIFCAKE